MRMIQETVLNYVRSTFSNIEGIMVFVDLVSKQWIYK